MPHLTELGFKCWLRYVDDTFVFLENKNNIKSVIDLPNTQHPNKRFTSEDETNSRIVFVHVKVLKLEFEINGSKY